MPGDYLIQDSFPLEWQQVQAASRILWDLTFAQTGRRYFPVHGDPILRRLEDYDPLAYFIYTLSSWWEISVIDRINSGRVDNNFAIIMDINPAPETIYRLENHEPRSPEFRYKTGLQQMFPSLQAAAADAMYKLLRNGFGHNLFGREPGKIHFDNACACPPELDENQVLLVPPIKLALSMINSFIAKIALLLIDPRSDKMRLFKLYMTGQA